MNGQVCRLTLALLAMNGVSLITNHWSLVNWCRVTMTSLLCVADLLSIRGMYTLQRLLDYYGTEHFTIFDGTLLLLNLANSRRLVLVFDWYKMFYSQNTKCVSLFIFFALLSPQNLHSQSFQTSKPNHQNTLKIPNGCWGLSRRRITKIAAMKVILQ